MTRSQISHPHKQQNAPCDLLTLPTLPTFLTLSTLPTFLTQHLLKELHLQNIFASAATYHIPRRRPLLAPASPLMWAQQAFSGSPTVE